MENLCKDERSFCTLGQLKNRNRREIYKSRMIEIASTRRDVVIRKEYARLYADISWVQDMDWSDAGARG